jgi:hypothetical protein
MSGTRLFRLENATNAGNENRLRFDLIGNRSRR